MRIVSMTNEGQLSMMKNMLNSALKCGWDITQFHCYILDTQKDAATYGTSQFNMITIKKLEVILHNMILDKEVLWIDNDIYLFHNCLEDIVSKPGVFVMQDDLWGPCTGFFLVRSTPIAISKIQRSISWLKARIGQQVNDQHAFHVAIKQIPRVGIVLLDRDEYPNGQIYFTEKRTSKAKIVHSNYLTTTSEKIQRFKDHGLWDESDSAFEKVKKYYI